MKKLTLTIVLILSHFLMFAQTEDSCLPQGITFTTQDQIDNFQTNYPGCTEVEGDVTIWGTDITNLTGLNVLTSIGGELLINNNPAMTDLSGLEGLTSIGGNLKISSNSCLINLDGLVNITSLGGHLGIWSNDLLTNLNGLEGLTSLEGSLQIMGSPCLKSLNGLNNLTTIGFSCDISYNDSLTSLTGLESLTSITSFLKIGNNEVLTNMQGLDNLNYIGGNLNVYGNSSLTSFEGLENLTSVARLEITANNALTSLTGLENLTYIGWYTVIKHNSSLSICEEQWLCNYLSDPGGYVDIYNNAVGCNSVVELANACGGSMLCLPYGNYVLSSQSDIDNFQLAFPDCAELEGDVIINGSDITNLYGLNLLVSIEGDLHILENSALTSCVGLDSLTSIGGDMKIGNPILASLTGLEGLTFIGGDLQIYGNDALTSLTGLDLVEAGSITNLKITNNYFLSECHVLSVCNYLANPNGTIVIDNNAEGCNDTAQVNAACLGVSIEEIKDEYDFVISPNPVSDQAILSLFSESQASIAIFIYNTTGICLKNWQFQNQQPGEREFKLDLKDLQAGIYFCRIQIGNKIVTKKIIKTK